MNEMTYKVVLRISIHIAHRDWTQIHNLLCGARTRRFITALTTAHQQSLSWASQIQSTPPPPPAPVAIVE
jgi:hypothetical protein